MPMRQRTYYTYMLASRTRVLYTGVTNNLERRLAQHRSKQIGSFTAQYRCDRLVWFERHSDATLAITREKQIKGWTRAKKKALIEQTNRTWDDLSQGWNLPIERPGIIEGNSKATADPSLRSG
jgi:putative endonuclease